MKIDDVIKEYVENIDTTNIGKLLNIQAKLATLTWNMAEYIGNLGINYIELEHARKDAYHHIMMDEEREKTSVKYAEMEAFLKTSDARLREKKMEMDWRKLRLKLEQVNKIIDHLTMKISQLKKEEEQARFQGN